MPQLLWIKSCLKTAAVPSLSTTNVHRYTYSNWVEVHISEKYTVDLWILCKLKIKQKYNILFAHYNKKFYVYVVYKIYINNWVLFVFGHYKKILNVPQSLSLRIYC